MNFSLTWFDLYKIMTNRRLESIVDHKYLYVRSWRLCKRSLWSERDRLRRKVDKRTHNADWLWFRQIRIVVITALLRKVNRRKLPKRVRSFKVRVSFLNAARHRFGRNGTRSREIDRRKSRVRIDTIALIANNAFILCGQLQRTLMII